MIYGSYQLVDDVDILHIIKMNLSGSYRGYSDLCKQRFILVFLKIKRFGPMFHHSLASKRFTPSSTTKPYSQLYVPN
jgi:hypothetical protein